MGAPWTAQQEAVALLLGGMVAAATGHTVAAVGALGGSLPRWRGGRAVRVAAVAMLVWTANGLLGLSLPEEPLWLLFLSAILALSIDSPQSYAAFVVEDAHSAGAVAGLRAPVATLARVSALAALLWLSLLHETQPRYPHAARVSFSLPVAAAVTLVIGIFAARSCRRAVPEPRSDELLPRAQSAEWKGWMQLVLLLYHYAHLQVLYKVVRVLVSSFLWLTGFGVANSAASESAGSAVARTLTRQLWRLLFAGVLFAAVMNNHVWLYYAVPLHAFFFLLVWLLSRAARLGGFSEAARLALFAVAAVLFVLHWHAPGLFAALWAPLAWSSLSLEAGRFLLHDWQFRTALEHIAVLAGVWLAWAALQHHRSASVSSSSSSVSPSVSRAELASPASPPTLSSRLFAPVLVLGFVLWLHALLALPARPPPAQTLPPTDSVPSSLLASLVSAVGSTLTSYNAVHPFLAPFPILAFVLLRNATQSWRAHTSSLFVWLGEVSLELFLLQHHVWLVDNAKRRPVWFDESGGAATTDAALSSAPLGVFVLGALPTCVAFAFNVLLSSAVLLAGARVLFEATGDLRDVFLPASNSAATPTSATASGAVAASVAVGASVAAARKPREREDWDHAESLRRSLQLGAGVGALSTFASTVAAVLQPSVTTAAEGRGGDAGGGDTGGVFERGRLLAWVVVVAWLLGWFVGPQRTRPLSRKEEGKEDEDKKEKKTAQCVGTRTWSEVSVACVVAATMLRLVLDIVAPTASSAVGATAASTAATPGSVSGYKASSTLVPQSAALAVLSLFVGVLGTWPPSRASVRRIISILSGGSLANKEA